MVDAIQTTTVSDEIELLAAGCLQDFFVAQPYPGSLFSNFSPFTQIWVIAFMRAAGKVGESGWRDKQFGRGAGSRLNLGEEAVFAHYQG